MRIKDAVMYHASIGHLIGFLQYADPHSTVEELSKSMEDTMEPKVATHVLALMVCGIFSNLKAVFAYFPCSGFTSDRLFFVIWPAVGILVSVDFAVRADGCRWSYTQ